MNTLCSDNVKHVRQIYIPSRDVLEVFEHCIVQQEFHQLQTFFGQHIFGLCINNIRYVHGYG